MSVRKEFVILSVKSRSAIIEVIKLDIKQDPLHEFLAAVISGNEEQARAILAAHQELPKSSPHYNERFAQSAKLLLDFGANADAFIAAKDDPCDAS